MRFISITAGLVGALLLAGCAGGPAVPQHATISYVSPVLYETIDCNEIAAEAEELSIKAREITGFANRRSTDSSVIYWPVGLQAKGNGTASAKLGRIKYQFEALEKAARREKCKFRFKRNFEAKDGGKSALTGWQTKLS